MKMTLNQRIKKALKTKSMLDFSLRTPEQINKFIRKLRLQSSLLSYAEIIPMKTKTKKLSKIDFTKQFLYPVSEGTGLTDSQRNDPDFEGLSIVCDKYMGEIKMSFETMTDTIEETDFEETLRTIIEEKVAENLAYFFWNSDKSSTNPLLNRIDGFLKIVENYSGAHIYDFLNNPIDAEGNRLAGALRMMPEQYKRTVKDLKFIMHHSPLFDYQRTITVVETNLGDIAKVEDYVPPFMGVGFIKEPLIETYLAGSDVNSKALITIPTNLAVGINQDFNIKLIPNDYDETYVLHTSGWCGCQIIEPDAVVLLDNIQHTA